MNDTTAAHSPDPPSGWPPVPRSVSPGPPPPAARTGPAAVGSWTVLRLPLEDPRVTPLVEGLTTEYDTRYGSMYGGASEEMRRYPAEEFAAPHGALLIVQEDGESVAGGAYRRYDRHTAELKRIWTHPGHRRRGLARYVLTRLEAEAVRNGYRRLYLTTGPRQPEARHLYLVTGYRPGFDLEADPETLTYLAFTKELRP